ncbi:hypothetical protein I6Y99_004769 [Vibrio parahaemolyticus]|uniref:type VI secretion system-associated protein TagO n=2 Tax=Vibrio owensii TaxID=696485 RepID=UPI001A2C6BF7|nr:hypothetical protein [Vibrio parahaemolyticus]
MRLDSFCLCGVMMMTALTCSVNGWASSLSQKQVSSLYQCREEPERLVRLACFDEVMQTPINEQRASHSIEQVHYPALWRRVWQATEHQNAPLVWQTDEKDNAWIALTEQSSSPAQAILVLSCIDNLSRVDVLMSKPMEALTLRLNVNSRQQVSLRSDDFGVMFSSPRGLPAIDVMKALAWQETVSLHSPEEAFSPLLFNVREVKALLPQLQRRCRW